MSDATPLPPRAQALDRAILAARREALGLRVTAKPVDDGVWSAGLASVLLSASILFLLIGPAPYMHERPFDPDTGAAVLSPLNRYAWFALTGLAAPLLWMKRDRIIGLCLKIWPLLVLYAWFSISTLWALDPPTSQRRLILLLCQTAVGSACCLGLTRAQAIHRVLAISCAIIVLIDLASWILLPSISQTDVGLAAIHNHKNSLGLAMMFSEFVCAPFLISRRNWGERIFWFFIAASAMALLVASLSKTSLGITITAFVAGPILILIFSTHRTLLCAIVTTTIALLIAGLLGWLCVNSLQGADPFQPFRGVTFTERTDVWQFVLSEVAQRPLKGAGFASFWDINPMVQPSLQTDLWFVQPETPTNEAHNGYLDLLVSTGLVGLTLSVIVLLRWIGLGLSLLRQALRSKQSSSRAQLPYLVFLAFFPILIAAHNFLESSYFNTIGLFSFMVVFMGIEVDQRYPKPPVWLRSELWLKRR